MKQKNAKYLYIYVRIYKIKNVNVSHSYLKSEK